ncbi:MAG: GntR family transcriptional regulator [Planctomycetes bacterium]|nr:GntR family transcriptional regulator [Planctomycetota bacterium]
MTIEPIHRANFVDQAYRAIKQFIIGGELAPGSQLKIEVLSRRLGVSSSPIREALRRLENERWVETIPFRGAFVRPLDEAELAELYEFREIIELAALGKLMRGRGGTGLTGFTEPGSDRRLDVLGGIVAEIETALAASDAMAYLRADQRFHQAIVDMAGNRRLSELFRTLVEQGRSFMLGRTPEAMARSRRGRDQHSELLELIRRGDRRGARRLLRRHLRVSLSEVRRTTGRVGDQPDES